MDPTPAILDYKKTILVVDDDPVVLKYVSELLANTQYRILIANNPREALQQSADCTGKIDVLLSDFQMEGMTGVDLATKICKERPDVKVLLMSGFTDGMLVLNAGWHYLTKPFVPSQLRALVAGLLYPDKDFKFTA